MHPKSGPRGQNAERKGGFDLDALLHPAHAFPHPMEVVKDPDLTLNEKRAILASWASDTGAAEAVAELRAEPVGLDDIMDALRLLDHQGGPSKPRSRYHRVLRERIPGVFGRKDRDGNRDQAA